MKHCKIPVGCKLADKPCCADCMDKTCEARCWNSPERCKCWTTAAPKQPRKGPPPPRKADPLQVAMMRGRGMTRQEIARQLGCSVMTVARALQKLGV